MMAKKEKPFNSGLSALKSVALPQTQAIEPRAMSKPTVSAETEDDLFAKAMAGTLPLHPDPRGRVAPPPPAARQPASDELALADLAASVDSCGFVHEGTSAAPIAFILGLDRKVVRSLKRGEFIPGAELDLHGERRAGARARLEKFIGDTYRAGIRCALVVTGKGSHSPDGEGVLRASVPTWLTEGRLAPFVLALCSAIPAHGGDGALYVLLRRHA